MKHSHPLEIAATGLVTSVGLSNGTACAALHCRLNHFDETVFTDLQDEPLIGAAVPWPEAASGIKKLARMALSSVMQALAEVDGVSLATLPSIPVILCIAETARAGRVPELDEKLFDAFAAQFGHALHADSGVMPAGQCAVAYALNHARHLLYQKNHRMVLIVAADSLLNRATIEENLAQGRLLASDVPSGFIPGEAAGAMLVRRPDPREEIQMLVLGLGAARESATLFDDVPMCGAGLSLAVNKAFADIGGKPPELELCIADVSGEGFYFEELALVRQRCGLAGDLWLPAESVGETGSVIGVIQLAWLLEARCKGNVMGDPSVLLQGNDSGQRSAIVVGFEYSAAYRASGQA